MKMDPVVFREYDIRGVYNVQFNNQFAFALGKALTSYIRKVKNLPFPKITVGFDARLSSPELANSLSEGIKSSGGHAVLLGLVTTPISYFSTFEMQDVAGAIMVTGSHNPPDYNGFKISMGHTTLVGHEIKELEQIITNKNYSGNEQDGQRSSFDIFPLYLDRYSKEFEFLKPIPLVIDGGNGAAGIILRRLYESVGLQPKVLFETPDGNFPNHHPDPTVEENLEDLRKEVLKSQSLIGIGFDGDADRLGVIDERGRTLSGDELLALFSRFVLKDNPGATIVGDVKCSDRLFKDIEIHGGQAVMWKSGHSLVKKKMVEADAAFGGEMSGHIFFRDRNYGFDDALYAGLRIVEILSRTGKTLTELLSDFPTSVSTPELRIETTEEKKHLIVDSLIQKFSKDTDEYKVNHLDGVRVTFQNGWALARVSNTQPVLVLRFESDTESGLQKIRERFEKIVNPLLG